MAQAGGPASGVMMIPIPQGRRSTSGGRRRAGAGGAGNRGGGDHGDEGQQLLVPLPEGSSYLGFIFARGESPEAVEQALRRSHAELRFHIATRCGAADGSA